MTTSFSHSVALAWAAANASDFFDKPAEFGLKAAQVHLAVDAAFVCEPAELDSLIAKLTALSVPSETLQLLRPIALQCLASPCHDPEKQADAEGSV
jgi:hypothetical protein